MYPSEYAISSIKWNGESLVFPSSVAPQTGSPLHFDLRGNYDIKARALLGVCPDWLLDHGAWNYFLPIRNFKNIGEKDGRDRNRAG
jgi:hypothetical protein